jgi:prepilin-type N-terminal cleavage/methylation domain-containing protein
MRLPRSGFTLLEVMMALLLVTVGLLGLVGTLGPITALAGEGRAHARVALALASRADSLRALLRAGAPSCTAPPAGMLQHSDGVLERWSTADLGGVIEVQIEASVPALRRGLPDTLVTRLPCP